MIDRDFVASVRDTIHLVIRILTAAEIFLSSFVESDDHIQAVG